MLSAKSLSAVVLLAGAFMVSASATTAPLGTSSAAYSGYDLSNATDTGAGSLISDYASASLGTATHLDFAITGTTAGIAVYDRTTSGGPNNAFYGGLFDFTTQFELIFSDNSDFSSPLATYMFTKADPAVHSSPADFLFTSTFAPVTADYVRYQVLAANGLNPGVADISFASTPEPQSLVLLGTGVLGLAGMVRRRMSSK